MAAFGAFTTTVDPASPTDSNSSGDKEVSGFITVASFTKFSAMTGAIASAWGALRAASSSFDRSWVPLVLCLVFAGVSFASSKPGSDVAKWGPALFIALINSLTLFSAVVGATEVVEN